MSKLYEYFNTTPMPRTQSDPYAKILAEAVPISLAQPKPAVKVTDPEPSESTPPEETAEAAK